MSVTNPVSLFQYAIASLGQAFSPAVSIQNASDFAVIFTDATTFADTTLVLNVDYTVAGTFTAGVCTAPTITLEGVGLHYAVGGTLTIERATPLTQPTNKVDGTKYLAATDNNALDWIVYGLQELRDMLKRSLRLPVTSPEQAEILKATRRLQVVGFDADGNVITYPLSAAVFASGQGIQVSSISAMKAVLYAAVSDKFQITLSGYYQPGDGGGGLLYVDKADTTTADDGVMVFVASDGTRLKRPASTEINIRQAGAKLDGLNDDNPAFQAAVDYVISIGGGAVYLTSGSIRITQPVNVYGSTFRKIKIYGDSNLSTVIKADFTSVSAAAAINVGNSAGARTYVQLSSFQVEGINDANTDGIYCNYTGSFSEIESVFCWKMRDGFRVANDYNMKISNCYATNNLNNGLTIGKTISGGSAPCNNISIFHGQYGTNGNTGIEVTTARALGIYQCAVEANSVYNINLITCQGCSINGVYIEYADSLTPVPTAQVNISGCIGVSISGLSCSAFDHNSSNIINIDASYVSIDGLSIESSGSSTYNAVGINIIDGSNVSIRTSSIANVATGINAVGPVRVSIDNVFFPYTASPLVTDNNINTIIDWRLAATSYVSASTIGAAVIKMIHTIDGNLIIKGLPSSPSGLANGNIWADGASGNVLKLV